MAVQHSPAASEPREASGVRPACRRCRAAAALESGSKLHALQTLCAALRQERGIYAASVCGDRKALELAERSGPQDAEAA